MADNLEDFALFTIGEIVGVKTCLGGKYEGEVIAFDYQSKVLIIKCKGQAGRANYHDVRMINLDCLEYVVTRKEVETPVNGVESLLLPKIQQVDARAFYFVRKRRKLVKAKRNRINRTGVNVFLAVAKTIPMVDFRGKHIIVWNNVRIEPPYLPEHCYKYGEGNDSDVNIIRKILEKHYEEQAKTKNSQSQQPQSGPSLPKAKSI